MSRDVPVDYYATLQVHPEADQEVIDAAYRQLMRKYHPDMAGSDTARAAVFHERAKAINQAYAVLRDPTQRFLYDRQRFGPAYARPQAAPAPDGVPQRGAPPRPAPEPTPTQAVAALDEERRWNPLQALAAGYYLLPGPYEWEPEAAREALAVMVLPPLGVAAWALASGRLNLLLSHWPGGPLLVWAVLLVCSYPLWRVLPRLALAVGPSLLLVTGSLDGVLRTSHVAGWFAWSVGALLSLLLSARLFVYAVVPTLAVCWLLAWLT
jgi:hypothetical protein